MIAKSIVRKNEFLINKLVKSGRTDLNIIALILCESHFRKNHDRFVEYFSMPLLFLFKRKKFVKLSIGIGQIQIKHWNKLYNNQLPISIDAYLRYFSVFENYDLLKSLIEQNFNTNYSDSKLIAFHTGETRKYHFDLYRELKMRIKLHLTIGKHFPYKKNHLIY